MNHLSTNPSFLTQNQDPTFQLEDYSGPLDLLLSLIRKQEMDIFQIDIHKITSQYVDYLKQVPQPDLQKAGEFILLASWLIYIKSKSLLPQQTEPENEPTAEELKHKLSRLLENYQKFKKIAELLNKKHILGRDCWASLRVLQSSPPLSQDIKINQDKGLFLLIEPYNSVLIRRKAKKNYKPLKPLPSLFHWLKQSTRLWIVGKSLKFKQLSLFKKHGPLLGFLSILELSKAGFVKISQKQLFSSIHVFVKKSLTLEDIKKISITEDNDAKTSS